MTTFLKGLFHSMLAGDGLEAESYNKVGMVVVGPDLLAFLEIF
jgi:hypothetical protein